MHILASWWLEQAEGSLNNLLLALSTHFAFLDSLDIDQEIGVIYFVDSEAIFRTGFVALKLLSQLFSNITFNMIKKRRIAN